VTLNSLSTPKLGSRHNKLKVIAALLIPFCCASTAMAQTDNPDGPYAGVGWGQFNLNINSLSDAGTAAHDIVHSNDNAWKAFAGYRFNRFLALEAAYIDLGKPSDRFSGTGSDGNYRADIGGFSPAIIGTLPLGPVELFAKIGEYYYDSKVKVDLDDPGPSIESSHRRNDLLYGGGVGMTFFEHLHVRAEYETIEIKNAKHSDAFWLSAAWRF